MKKVKNLNRNEWIISLEQGVLSIVDAGEYYSIKYAGLIITANKDKVSFIYNKFDDAPEENIFLFSINGEGVNVSIEVEQSEHEAIKQDPMLGTITVLNCE